MAQAKPRRSGSSPHCSAPTPARPRSTALTSLESRHACALDDAGVDVLDVEVRRPTLDDVFLTLTGKRADDDGEEFA